jgi:Domain of unknown function (DUF4157)
MKTNETQTSTSHQPTATKPFFGGRSDQAFFSTERAPATPFFQPPASATLQAKPGTDEAKGFSELDVQRMPAFASEVMPEGTVQRSPSPQSLSAFPIQTKLTIGPVGDGYEQEADRVAAQVVEQIHAPAAAQSTPEQSVQRQEEKHKELQAKPEITPLQRMEAKPEELQAKSILQRRGKTGGEASCPDSSVEQRPNKTGMPDALKAGVESLSGYSLDDVRVRYNSSQPAKLQALAYTQGTEIHVASGQEEHLPHEAWHVVQQAQGRVKPTMQLTDGLPVNDDAGLEHEADVMGTKASSSFGKPAPHRAGPMKVSTLEHTTKPPSAYQLGTNRPAVVAQRHIDPATIDQHLGVTPQTPTQDDASKYLMTTVGPTIPPIKKLLAELPDKVGDQHLETISKRWATIKTTCGCGKKDYNATAARAAINAVIAALNEGETFAEVQMVGPAANFTTSVQAQANLNNVVVPRYNQVLEMATSLNHPNPIGGGSVAQEAGDAAAKLLLATAAATAAPYNAVAAKSAIMVFSSAVNVLQNAAEDKMKDAVAGSIKIGTEFTFAHPSIAELNPENPKSNTAAFTTALGLITHWRELVESKPIKVTGVEVEMAITQDPLTGGSKEGKAPRFTYNWKGGTWWWRLNIDPGCLETQTEPMTPTQAKMDYEDITKTVINTIMTNHIFAIAPLLKAVPPQPVAPDALTGGGHITLDAASTFLGNSRFFRNLLVLYANDTTWTQEDADDFNAPTISELTKQGKVAFKQTITAFDQTVGTAQQQTIEQLSDALVKNVFVPKHFGASAQEGNKEKRANQPAHYQATNVEHMTTAEKGVKRLEMRRFDAQTSVDDLLADLERLTSLVAASRRPGLVPLTV